MPMSRRQASSLIRHFESYVRQDEERGAGHPDLMEWHQERYEIARERLIQHMMGNPLAAAAMRMPEQPHVEY